MRRFTAVLLATALVASGCGYLDETFDEVKKEHGVDLRNPVDAASAVSGADAIGNKGAEDGLEVMKGFRREQHTSAGDAAADRGDFATAREEYQKALAWTKEEPYTLDLGITKVKKNRVPDPAYAEQIRDKQSALRSKIAGSHMKEGHMVGGYGDSSKARSQYLKAASLYESNAKNAGDHTSQAIAYKNAAYARLRAGDNVVACRHAQQSVSLGQSFDTAPFCRS